MSKATSGAKSILVPETRPPGKRSLRTRDASGMRQSPEVITKAQFEAKAIHSWWERQYLARLSISQTSNSSCRGLAGDMNSTSPSTHSHLCHSSPAARNSSQVMVVFDAMISVPFSHAYLRTASCDVQVRRHSFLLLSPASEL